MRTSLASFLFTLLFHFTGSSQVKLTVQAPDSLAFLASVDAVVLNNVPSTSLTTIQHPLGKHVISLQLMNGQTAQLPVLWKQPCSVVYEVRWVKSTYKLTLVSESISATPAPVEPDTLSVQIPTTEVYEGKKGCELALNNELFSFYISEMRQLTFESKRVLFIKSQLPSMCIQVDQLALLLGEFELEDNRLSVIETALPYVYDQDRLSQLIDHFFLEKNKTKVLALISP